MVDPVRRSNFSRGANNRVARGRLPEGFYRESVNLDPLTGGGMALRAGYDLIYEGDAVRGVLGIGSYLLIADGTELVEFDTDTNSSRTLRTIVGSGLFAGTVWNDELFFCTATECLRYRAGTVREWGVRSPGLQPTPTLAAGGAIRAGAYKFATTFVNAYGEESGASTADAFVVPADGYKATFVLPAPPSGGSVRLYCSFNNSTTLYLQGEAGAAGAFDLTNIADNTTTLLTQFCGAPSPGAFVAERAGVILIAQGNVLWVTQPMSPHLLRPAYSFFQYPKPITMVQCTDDGAYIGADATYWVTGIETDKPTQRTVSELPPVFGSGTEIASADTDASAKQAVWMTAQGPVVGAAGGNLRFLTRAHYVPTVASQGASGIVEHGGNQMVVTTLRGIPKSNPLVAGDYVDAEIIYP